MLFELKNIIKRFGENEVLSIDSLTIDKGGVIGLAGPNGSGKSTFLEILSSIQNPSEGDLFFKGKRLNSITDGKIAMVLQDPVMFNLSVYDNVAYGYKAKRTPKDEYHGRILKELELLGLSGLALRNARSLSGGERQKVAIARASVLNPEVLILDEPTSGLDFHSRESLKGLIQKLYEVNPERTIIVASHDKDFLHSISHRTYIIVNKQVFFESIENFYHATVLDSETVRIGSVVDIKVSAEKKGDVNLIISPENIVLSKDSLVSSMRNSIRGHVSKITHQNSHKDILLWVNIGVDICCKITDRSYRDMQLHVGDEIWVSFKATSVKLFYQN